MSTSATVPRLLGRGYGLMRDQHAELALGVFDHAMDLMGSGNPQLRAEVQTYRANALCDLGQLGLDHRAREFELSPSAGQSGP